MLPNRSIWAAPRKPTSIRPPWRYRLNRSHMLVTAVAPVTIVGSPIESGSLAGRVHELEVRGDRPLGGIHGDVREADSHEADPLAGQLPCGRHDHHLGLR